MDGITHFMAKLRRSKEAGNLLDKNGSFTSFVEDWNRRENAKGYQMKRRAKFLNPKLNGKELESANFTKVEDGLDAYASDFARGWGTQNGFVLETGKEHRTARSLEDTVPNGALLKMIK